MSATMAERYAEQRDIGAAWMGEIPEHWKFVRVKDLISKITSGVTPRGGAESYVDVGIPFLRSQNVHNDGLRLDDVSFISESTHLEMLNSQVKPGDIVFNITGASIARTCIVPEAICTANISQHIALLRPRKLNETKFISYYLQSQLIKDYVYLTQSGASKEAFNHGQMKCIPVPLPPRHEQIAIADYLDTKTAKIDRKIDLLSQKATQYGKVEQSLINETVTRGLDKSVPMKESGAEWIGEVPAHWEVKRFKEIFNKTHSGWTPDTAKRESFEGENIWVTIRDMDGGRHISSSVNKLSDKAVADAGISITPKGSLLFSFKLSIGKIAFAGCDLYTNEAIISIENEPKVNLNYFFHTLPIFLVLGAKKNIYGAKLLNQGIIFNTSLLCPPKEEQEAIAAYLDTKTAQIDRIVTAINTQIDKLKDLRKALINDVVTGKIKAVSEGLAV